MRNIKFECDYDGINCLIRIESGEIVIDLYDTIKDRGISYLLETDDCIELSEFMIKNFLFNKKE